MDDIKALWWEEKVQNEYKSLSKFSSLGIVIFLLSAIIQLLFMPSLSIFLTSALALGVQQLISHIIRHNSHKSTY